MQKKEKRINYHLQRTFLCRKNAHFISVNTYLDNIVHYKKQLSIEIKKLKLIFDFF